MHFVFLLCCTSRSFQSAPSVSQKNKTCSCMFTSIPFQDHAVIASFINKFESVLVDILLQAFQQKILSKYSIMRSRITTCSFFTTNYVPIFTNYCTSMTAPGSYMCTLSVRLKPLQLLKLIIILISFSVES